MTVIRGAFNNVTERPVALFLNASAHQSARERLQNRLRGVLRIKRVKIILVCFRDEKTRAISEDSGQTARMRRLIWVFACRTGLLVGFVVRWLIW